MPFIVVLFRALVPFLFFSTFFLGLRDMSAKAQNHLRIESFPSVAKQGEICPIRVSSPVSLKSVYVQFQGVRFPMALGGQKGAYEGLIAIDMNAGPATYQIKIAAMDRDDRVFLTTVPLSVKKANFGVQKLSLPSSMVDLTAKTLERVNQETRRLESLFQTFRDERLWGGAFIRPVRGALSGTFGVARIINGTRRGQHTGVDLRAEKGTPVLACNNGIVVLVDELFFSGKSVVLDHGWGLYSMYFHLSETLVSEGDRVEKGAVMGRVGSTGRSTKPHLHWGIRMNGARVDPFSLPGLAKTEGSRLDKFFKNAHLSSLRRPFEYPLLLRIPSVFSRKKFEEIKSRMIEEKMRREEECLFRSFFSPSIS